MHEYLFIQMARMGDLLQSIPLIAGVKHIHPGCRICVLVDEALVDIAGQFQIIDRVLCAPLNNLKRCNDLQEMYQRVQGVVGPLAQEQFDVVVNLNYSMLTALLASVLKKKVSSGYWLSEDRGRIEIDPWFVFFVTMVGYGGLAPFNLVDYWYLLLNSASTPALQFARNAGLQKPSDDGCRVSAPKNESMRRVAIQLGTRHAQRQWPIERFVELVNELLREKQVSVYLVGKGQNDKQLAGELLAGIAIDHVEHPGRVINCVDTTSFSEIACLLSDMDLLISGDTGTMHIAANVGCPVLALFFGPAYAHHTGPYGRQCWILQSKAACGPCVEDRPQCSSRDCRFDIKGDDVVAMVRKIVFHEPLQLQSEQCRALAAQFDDYGITYKNLLPQTMTALELWNISYREMGKSFLNESYEPGAALGHAVCAEFDRCDQTASPDALDSYIQTGRQVLAEFYRNCGGLSVVPFEENAKFWHPWIAWVNRLGIQDKASAAVSLRSGIKALEHISLTVH